jgi:Fe-S-cluster containining protein
VYSCSKCPGFCCSYPVIAINKRDVERLARFHSVSFEVARKRYTKSAHGHKYLLRRKKDPHFGQICRFFDTKERRCTIYHGRPSTCRSYPGPGRCGYYDFLSFERRAQDDPKWIAITDHKEN